MALQAVKGMNDVLPDEVARWHRVEALAREVFGAHGYREIRPPLLEVTELFERSVGDTTDIVQKEMYTFENRSAERGDAKRLTLRPEGTAGVVRAYVEHKMWGQSDEHRFYYLGPMFRHERPQKGRFRQFHQVGCEALGMPGPGIDVEMLSMLQQFLTAAGVGGLYFQLNTLGCPTCRAAGLAALKAYFEPHRAALCADCQRRLDQNALRVLDCKVEADQALARGAPTVLSSVLACTQGCGDHYRAVRAGLDALKVPFQENPLLVRGLDYYTRTVFEACSSELGSQSAVTGGGRYDRLVEEFGGQPTPAIGFALGVERLLMLQKDVVSARGPELSVVVAEESARSSAMVLVQGLRARGTWCDLDHSGKSVKSQMRRADKAGSTWVLVLGGLEMQAGKATLKNLRGGASKDVALEIDHIQAVIRSATPGAPSANP
ncbi:MAG: histidine--tRNA ligase [Deltaproteobacteria bacterium]|nr:histidine--tRNA ligase [Deltaproteobacteria bacterium]